MYPNAQRSKVMLTAKTFEDPRRLVALLVQCRRPESFTAQLVGEFIHRRADFVHRLPRLVEALLRACPDPIPPR